MLCHLNLTLSIGPLCLLACTTFGNAEGVVKEVLRVLKNGGRFVVLDPVSRGREGLRRHRS